MLYVARTFLFCLSAPATSRPTAFQRTKIRFFDGKTILVRYNIERIWSVFSILTRWDENEIECDNECKNKGDCG